MAARSTHLLRPLGFERLERAGRLGNQLWQIASTLGIARRKGMRPLFPSSWSYRPFFSCPDVWFGTVSPRMPQSTVYAREIDSMVRIYLQDLALWTKVQDEVRQAFQPSELAQEIVDEEWAKLTGGATDGFVAVHVRRGDYVTNPDQTINALDASYYHDALSEVSGGLVRVVFSDDIEWCKEQRLGDLYYEGIARPKEQEAAYMSTPVLDWIDMFLMAKCDQHVISNSTYSWWGAWLSDNPSPIYPGFWYGTEMAKIVDFKLMIPDGWREIEC